MHGRIAAALSVLALVAAHAQTPPRPAKAGDVHVYAVQQKTEKLNYTETVTITAIEGERIKTAHTRSDKPGTIEGLYGRDWSTHISGVSGMRMSPPSKVLQFPLAVGTKWSHEYEGTALSGARLRIKTDSTVAAEEKLTTPAGEFQTQRIDSDGYLSGISFQGGWAFRQKVWYAPAIDRIVRTEFREHRTLGSDNVHELKEFKPAD